MKLIELFDFYKQYSIITWKIIIIKGYTNKIISEKAKNCNKIKKDVILDMNGHIFVFIFINNMIAYLKNP